MSRHVFFFVRLVNINFVPNVATIGDISDRTDGLGASTAQRTGKPDGPVLHSSQSLLAQVRGERT